MVRRAGSLSQFRQPRVKALQPSRLIRHQAQSTGCCGEEEAIREAGLLAVVAQRLNLSERIVSDLRKYHVEDACGSVGYATNLAHLYEVRDALALRHDFQCDGVG